MTVSIKLIGVDFVDYLSAYKAAGNHGAHGEFNDSLFSGRKYASTEKHISGWWFGRKAILDGDPTKFGFVAETLSGQLEYSIWDHKITGSLHKISVGKGVKADFTLAEAAILFYFSDLDLGNKANTISRLIYSLKKPASNTTSLAGEIHKHDTRQSGTPAAEAFRGFAKHDAFIFESRETGHDVITSFDANKSSAGHDVLELSTCVFADIEAVFASARQAGPDTVITIDDANTITLQDIALSKLDIRDFVFV